MTDPLITAPGAAEDAGRWVTARIGASGFHTDVAAGGHTVIVDEPTTLGGTSMGPTPYEYLLTALGGCTVMTLRLYADRKGWPLESASVHLRSGRSHERDCEKCDEHKVDIGMIERRIELSGPITDEQRRRLLEIADRCPVKQTLERGIRVETVGIPGTA
ncbi:MAG: OsmC family protein [Gemmatimonadales bacterium]